MSVVISQIDIVNKAQILLGSSEKLSGINDPGPIADAYRTLWRIAVRSALEAYPWNFATAREWLNPDSIAPQFGYSHRYALPPDCVRWLPWARGEELYFDGEEEAGYILCNVSDRLPVRFTRLVEDMKLWTPLFCDSLAYTLAMERCEAATTLRGLYSDLATAREAVHDKARVADALKTGQRRRGQLPVQSRWASARYRPGGIGAR